MTVEYPSTTVQLSGRDGNVYAIMGAVATALRQGVGREASQKWCDGVRAAESYDAVLQLAMRTVNVE